MNNRDTEAQGEIAAEPYESVDAYLYARRSWYTIRDEHLEIVITCADVHMCGWMAFRTVILKESEPRKGDL